MTTLQGKLSDQEFVDLIDTTSLSSKNLLELKGILSSIGIREVYDSEKERKIPLQRITDPSLLRNQIMAEYYSLTNTEASHDRY